MIRLTFSDPIYLWYLLSIPLLAMTHFLLLRRSRQKAIRFANFAALQRVKKQKIFTSNYFLLLLRIITLIALTFAISGTTLWYEGRANNNDFVLAIDVSASMAAQDIPPSRLEAAKTYALSFVDNIRSSTSIGVVSFSGVTLIEQIPTEKKEKVRFVIEDLHIISAGGTDIAGAIITATNLLAQSEQGKTIILLTDGSNTAGFYDEDPISAAARYALDHSVRVHTIGVGSLAGPLGYLPEYYNISAIYEEQDLQYISNSTGGQYYHAISSADIQAAYDALADDYHTAWIELDLAALLLLTGLLMLFIEWGLINTRFKRVP